MVQARFDQSARLVARLDPEGVFSWLLPGFAAQMQFVRWLDTRTTSGPDTPAFGADTVAELTALNAPAPPWLAVLKGRPSRTRRMAGEPNVGPIHQGRDRRVS
jgi:hypothetical protein